MIIAIEQPGHGRDACRSRTSAWLRDAHRKLAFRLAASGVGRPRRPRRAAAGCCWRRRRCSRRAAGGCCWRQRRCWRCGRRRQPAQQQIEGVANALEGDLGVCQLALVGMNKLAGGAERLAQRALVTIGRHAQELVRAVERGAQSVAHRVALGRCHRRVDAGDVMMRRTRERDRPRGAACDPVCGWPSQAAAAHQPAIAGALKGALSQHEARQAGLVGVLGWCVVVCL